MVKSSPKITKYLHQRKRSKDSLSDEWWTTNELFKELIEKYNFNPKIDVAATEKNSKCDWYIDKKNDALKTAWIIQPSKKKGSSNKNRADVWCNPPNSKLSKFIRRAKHEHEYFTMRIMMIVPANAISSKAWWDCIENNGIFYQPIFKRPKFLLKGKKSKHSARNAYMVVIWGYDD